MLRNPLVHASSSPTRQPSRAPPISMAQVAYDSARTRSPTNPPRIAGGLPPPPPYEPYDTFSTTFSSPYAVDYRTASAVQSIPLSADVQRSQVAPRLRRQPAPNLSIPHLREALHSLESRMASLLSERDLLESRLEQAVRLQSPIHRLPGELLSVIFEIGVLQEEDEDAILLSNIMLVCHYWRDVAIDTPAMWSRIRLGTHHSSDRARLKLQRSKAFPLRVSVDFNPRNEYGTVTTESIMRAMDLVRPAISRWKVFQLTVPTRTQATAALRCCRDHAPMLEAFSVRVVHSMQEDHHSSSPLPLFDSRTPRLRSCSFTSFDFKWDMSLVIRLRVLKLDGYWNGFSPSIDVVLAILRASPDLEYLALRNMSDVEPGSCSLVELDSSVVDDSTERIMRTNDSRFVHLPKLKRASFYYSGNVRTRAILAVLVFPALERVDLAFLDNISPIIEHLRRQSLTCLPLRHLRIESSFFNELRVAKLLRRLPSLTTLEFVDTEDVSSHLAKTLSMPVTAQTWICPKITDLCLEGCTSLDWESLRSLVESRLPAQSPALPRSVSTRGGYISSTSSASANTHAMRKSVSSASAFAAQAHILSRVPVTHSTNGALGSIGTPRRLDSINLNRCPQISREMIQWLRMYVSEVKCETGKGTWGEAATMYH